MCGLTYSYSNMGAQGSKKRGPLHNEPLEYIHIRYYQLASHQTLS